MEETVSEEPGSDLASPGLTGALEAVLFVADQPLTAARLAEFTGLEEKAVKAELDRLSESYAAENRGWQLRRIAGGYRLYTHPAYAQHVERLVLSSDFRRLTQAALETLAIVAYMQPVTRAQVGAIRGVNSEAVLSSLLDKGLVREVGRQDSPGQPILYATTPVFLEAFGLDRVEDLPPLTEFAPDEETRLQIEEKLRSGPPAEDEVSEEEPGTEDAAKCSDDESDD